MFSAGAAWSLNAGDTVLRAGYDEGFKAPSLYQLFSQYGAAGLRPERARGWEVAAEQSLLDQHVRLSAVWFQRTTDNLIEFAFCPTTGTLPPDCYVPGTVTSRFGYYANVKKASARGLELTGRVNFGPGLRARQLQPGPGRRPYRRRQFRPTSGPRAAPSGQCASGLCVSLRADCQRGAALGKTLDRTGGSTWLADYWLADLRAEWKAAGGLTLYGRVGAC